MQFNKPKPSPPFIAIVGNEGAGKTTLAAEAVLEFGGAVIRVEDGLQKYEDRDPEDQPLASPVLSEPTPEKPEIFLDELYDAFDWARDNLKPGNILAIDSLSVLSKRLEQTVIHRYGVSNIGEAAGSFGKGYLEVEKEMLSILDELKSIRKDCGIAVIGLSHINADTLKNDPVVEAALCYTLRMDKKCADLVKSHAHAVLAIGFDMVITGTETDKTGKVTKAGRIRKVSKRHLICDASTPAYSQLCKNRFDLPAKLELPEGDLSLFDSIKFFEGK